MQYNASLVYLLPNSLLLHLPSNPAPLVTTSLFFVSLHLLPLCYIHLFGVIFRFHLQAILEDISLSLTFHLAWSPPGQSMLLQMAKFHSFYSWAVFQCVCVCDIFFIHSSVDVHWGCFHVLVIVNTSAINIGVFFFCFFFFRCILRSGIAESYGSSSFTFLRNLHTVFLSGCTNLHSHNDLQEFPFLGNLINILLFVNFLMIAILTVCDFDIHFPDDYHWISLLKAVVNKRQHLVR